MKIAISGASGTGKTTLARRISEHYQIPMNPIGSREVVKAMGFDNPYDVDKAGLRVEFQEKLFEAKREWELSQESFVTDRSYLDNWTYCILHMAEHLTEEKLHRHMKAMEIYDATMLLRMDGFQNLDDGIRQTNVLYHRYYELLLTTSALTPSLQPKTWVVPTDIASAEGRFQWFQMIAPVIATTVKRNFK